MAGGPVETFFALLERQEQGKLGTEQLLGLLSLYALLNILEYLQRGAGLTARAAAVSDPALQKALASVLGNSEGEAGQAIATLARSLGKNPATIMSLVNMLAGEKKESKVQSKG